jgi:hypothetical protein
MLPLHKYLHPSSKNKLELQTQTMAAIIFSPYKKELDKSDKDSVKLYEKEGSKTLPTKFTGEVKDCRLFISMMLHPGLQSVNGTHQFSCSR